MTTKHFNLAVTALLAMLILTLAACGGAAPAPAQPAAEKPAAEAPAAEKPAAEQAAPAANVVEIRYGLWDSAQQPAYEACAAEFSKANPNIAIKVEQNGWDDYWSGIQTGMIAGNAPDVFTNHLAKYPEFASKGQIVDIQPLVDRDKVPTDIYIGDLANCGPARANATACPKTGIPSRCSTTRKCWPMPGQTPKSWKVGPGTPKMAAPLKKPSPN
jgi:ABC-type glycerol-3-phosphate transport system substrate-binding protein